MIYSNAFFKRLDSPTTIFFKETASLVIHNSALIIAAIATHIFHLKVALPLAVMALAQLTSAFAINCYSFYNQKQAIHLQLYVLNFEEKHPKVRIVMFLICLAIIKIWLTLSCVLGLLLGTFSGIVSRADFYEQI